MNVFLVAGNECVCGFCSQLRVVVQGTTSFHTFILTWFLTDTITNAERNPGIMHLFQWQQSTWQLNSSSYCTLNLTSECRLFSALSSVCCKKCAHKNVNKSEPLALLLIQDATTQPSNNLLQSLSICTFKYVPSGISSHSWLPHLHKRTGLCCYGRTSVRASHKEQKERNVCKRYSPCLCFQMWRKTLKRNRLMSTHSEINTACIAAKTTEED